MTWSHQWLHLKIKWHAPSAKLFLTVTLNLLALERVNFTETPRQLSHQLIIPSVPSMLYFTLCATCSDFWGKLLDCIKQGARHVTVKHYHNNTKGYLQESTNIFLANGGNTVSGISVFNFARLPVTKLFIIYSAALAGTLNNISAVQRPRYSWSTTLSSSSSSA